MKPNWAFTEEDDRDGGARQAQAARAGASWRGFWSGSVGVSLRFGCVAGALVCMWLAVLAGTKIEAGVPAALPQGTAPVISPNPDQGAALFMPMEPADRVEPRPVQGPVAPRWMTLAPADLCKALDLGQKTTGWVQSEVYSSEWECLSWNIADAARPKRKSRKAEAEDADGKPSVFRLFSMARGTNEADARYVRFKISAPDEPEANAAAEALDRRLASLFAALGWAVPEEAHLSIKLRRPFLIEERGTTIRFVKEQMNDWSYNLIVTFPRKPAPRVAAAEPAESVDQKPVETKGAEH